MSNNQKGIFEVQEIEESDYKEEKRKYPIINYLACNWGYILIIAILLICNVLQFFSRHTFDSVIKILFINKDNEFQWLGVTAIVAIVSAIATATTAISKNKADLVAKSRIEWIQKVKELMSIYLTDVHYYPFLYQQFKKGEVSKKELNDLAKKIDEYRNLLILNFSDNKDNRQIIECINDCSKWIANMNTRYKSQGIEFKYKTIPVSNLTKVSRDYFKREWDKAKKGK